MAREDTATATQSDEVQAPADAADLATISPDSIDNMDGFELISGPGQDPDSKPLGDEGNPSPPIGRGPHQAASPESERTGTIQFYIVNHITD